jgi:N-hydroxyarylamine O-acetyltransferase
MIDLDAYFARIGYTGPPTATLETLRALHALHPMSIPFENLNPLLGRPVRLDAVSLQEKMIYQKRGGYCHEHNTLLKTVLEQLGFRITFLAGRVLWSLLPDAPLLPRTHIILCVETEDGPFIADVGFGGPGAQRHPIRLAPGLVQETDGGRIRIVEDTLFQTLELENDDGWHPVYRFTMEAILPVDVEVANWFTGTHPQSPFLARLIMHRFLPDGRIALVNRRLTRRYGTQPAEQTTLTTAQAMEKVFETAFGIECPVPVAEVFARVPA